MVDARDVEEVGIRGVVPLDPEGVDPDALAGSVPTDQLDVGVLHAARRQALADRHQLLGVGKALLEGPHELVGAVTDVAAQVLAQAVAHPDGLSSRVHQQHVRV